MDINTASRGELVRLIYEMAEKIEIQEGEIARLRELLHEKGKGIGNAKQPPSFVKANRKIKRKKNQRKKRNSAYTRKKETPTETVFHAEEVCHDCGGDLGKPVVAYSRQVIEIPVFKYSVAEHVVFRRWCFHCKKCIQPNINLKGIVIGKGRIGINLMAAIVTLRSRLRLPVGMIQYFLKLIYELSLSKGEIIELLHTAAQMGKPAYDKLLDEIRKSNVVHADETGGRENGRNGYFWSFSTKDVHFLLYRKSRAAKVVEEIVGKNSELFNGVLITDFYAAYNTYNGFHQRCWVHLLRDIHKLKEENKKHPPLRIWAKKVKQIYEEARGYPGHPPDTKIGIVEQDRIKKQHEFEERLRSICQPYLKKDTVMSTLCGRIITFLPELFMFIRFPEVISDNNPAERIIRHTVVARKISGGTRSIKGSETKTILTSLFDTWKLQNLNPLEQCRLLLSAC